MTRVSRFRQVLAANSAQTLDLRRLRGLCQAARGNRQKLGFNSEDVIFENGKVRSGNRSVPLAEAAGPEGLVGEDTIKWGDLSKTHQQSTFGAHFVEVGVDVATGESRIRRMLAVCAAGRILNPITARSQVIGAMTMGAGRTCPKSWRSIPAAAFSSTTISPAMRCRCMPISRIRR